MHFVFNRLNALQQNQSKRPSSSTATWKNKSEPIRKEMETTSISPRTNQETIVKDHCLAVDGVFFTCPVYPACLPYKELYDHIHQCLLQDLAEEPLMISVTMIQTLNRDRTKVEACINILNKYIQNIVDHPGEEKYRKIRKGNKVYQERVKPIIGVAEYLMKGCGFNSEMLPMTPSEEPGSNEEFYVLSEELAANTEQLLVAKEMLTQAEPLDVVLDRNLRVFSPNASASKIKVPDSFYTISSDEVKREQLEKTEEVEKSKQLRTKAMRDADSGPKRIYKFTVIRIRLPDGVLLQGTFRSHEKLFDVKEFVKEKLTLDWLPFELLDTIGKPFTDDNATLASLKLVPAALLNFQVDSTVTSEIAASSPDGKIKFLRDDIAMLMSDIE